MGRNPPAHKFLSTVAAPKGGGNKRDKAQLVWEDRLISRREEREADELRSKVEKLEKELEGYRAGAGVGGKEGGEGRGIESAKARIQALELELELAETSLKDLSLTHSSTLTTLTSNLSHLSSLTSRHASLSLRLSPSNPPEKSSSIEARQLRARVDHLGRQLDAKGKELARENHALGRVSEEIRRVREEKERVSGERKGVGEKVGRLEKELAGAKETRAGMVEGAVLERPGTSTSSAAGSREGVAVVPLLVESIHNLNREVDRLRSENMALLLRMVATDS